MNAWKEKITAIAPRPEVHEIEGQSFNFYPVSLQTAFKLRAVAQPLVKGLAVLFAENKADSRILDRSWEDAEGKGHEFVTEPVTPEIASFRRQQINTAVEDIFRIFQDESLEAIGEILMDSLCDLFPRDQEKPPVSEFLGTVTLPCLPEFLVGVAKANKGTFGPLASIFHGPLAQAVEAIKAKIEDKLTEHLGSSSEDADADPTPNEQPSSS